MGNMKRFKFRFLKKEHQFHPICWFYKSEERTEFKIIREPTFIQKFKFKLVDFKDKNDGASSWFVDDLKISICSWVWLCFIFTCFTNHMGTQPLRYC